MRSNYKIIGKHTRKLIQPLTILFVIFIMSGCATLGGPAAKLAKQDDEIFSKPMRPAKIIEVDEPVDDSDLLAVTNQNNDNAGTIKSRSTPTLSIEQKANIANDVVIPKLDSAKMISRLSFNNMSVSAFINEIFGNQLGLSFVIEPKVANASDLVTMRLASEVNQQALYKIATQTLAPYGVTTSLNENIIVFAFSENASAQDTPLLVSGRALPEVPFTNRPLFYAYPVKSVNARNILGYINQLFNSNELTTQHDVFSNSLIFQGQKAKIEQAVAAAKLFDRPEMSGMYSVILEPQISDVKTLSSNLEKVLKTEGFNVGIADQPGVAIRLLPLESVNQLIVFAKSREVLTHIENWADKIEVEKQSEIEDGLFFYPVQRTLASHIVGVLGQLGVANYSAPSGESDSQDGANRSLSRPINNPQRNNVGQSNSGQNGNYTVDEQLNTILFSGSGKQWQKALPIIKKLDKPAPSVMVEVILVEVQLNDSEETGVEWLANSSLGDFDLSFGTLGSLGLKGSGLNLFGLDNAGNTRAAINAFYKNDRANIRSRPRIMVKSGGEASIDVGNEIPVVTSTSQSTTDSNAPNIQNVQYRKTGVILDIKPTVHASGFVDIEINQELSEATESTSAGNPVILNRSISTTVTLRDGGSVLIGGLISSTSSEGSQGVQILGRLPLIGKLFRSDNNAQDRTELMIMIIPYILDTPGEAEALTDELQMQRIQSFN